MEVEGVDGGDGGGRSIVRVSMTRLFEEARLTGWAEMMIPGSPGRGVAPSMVKAGGFAGGGWSGAVGTGRGLLSMILKSPDGAGLSDVAGILMSLAAGLRVWSLTIVVEALLTRVASEIVISGTLEEGFKLKLPGSGTLPFDTDAGFRRTLETKAGRNLLVGSFASL